MSGSMLQIENLSSRWGRFSLQNVEIAVEEGEYFVILGPTGAGKTLLLETVAGFHLPDRGRVLIGGEDVTHLPPEKRRVGFVYQDYMLFPHFTVRQNIEYGLRYCRHPGTLRGGRVDEIASLLKIRHLLGRSTLHLSGGEKQRVSLARALAVEPRLLLLDEPLSAIDQRFRLRLREDLAELHDKTGLTTVHVTHDHEEARAMARRLAVMNRGRVAATGTPEDIFRKPPTEFVARFVGAENLLEGNARSVKPGSEVDVGGSPFRTTEKRIGEVSLVIRPEDIHISTAEAAGPNAFRGRVAALTEAGPCVRVGVKLLRSETRLTALVSRQFYDALSINVGSEVWVKVPPERVHLL